MKPDTRTGLTLGVGVLAAIIVLSVTYWLTRDRIEQSRHAWLLRGLSEVLPAGPFDADPLASVMLITEEALGSNTPMPIYRVYRDGQPLAAVLTVIAPDGYNGDIRLLLGVSATGQITGVRVTEHRETPGLGDDVDYPRSDWVTHFNGLSLQHTSAGDWTVRRQGGRFNAFTGATITPRAVIAAIHRALRWYSRNQDVVYQS